MLSFYEFDRLLRKNKRRQQWSEAFEKPSGSGQGGPFSKGSATGGLSGLAARLAALQQSQAGEPVDTEAPVEEPEVEAPPAAPVRTPSAKRQQGATRRQAGGVAGQSGPAPTIRVNQELDDNDPRSQAVQDAKAGVEGARRLGAGRGVGRFMQDKNRGLAALVGTPGSQVTKLQFTNNMMRGSVIKPRSGEAYRGESSYAGQMQGILQGDYNDRLNELDPRGRWDFDFDFEGHQLGQPWALAVEPGGSGQTDVTEKVFHEPTILKALRAHKLLFGPQAGEGGPREDWEDEARDGGGRRGSRHKEDLTLFRQQLAAGVDTADSHTRSIIIRALQFEKVLYADGSNIEGTFDDDPRNARRRQIAGEFRNLAGMKMTIDGLANRLGRIVGPMENDEEMFDHDTEHELDVAATIHLIRTARSGDASSNYANFFTVEGGKRTNLSPETVVMVNPPEAMGGGDDPTLHTGASDLKGGGGAGQIDVRQSIARTQRQARDARRRKQGGGGTQTMAAEAADWMNIYGLMEHWGF